MYECWKKENTDELIFQCTVLYCRLMWMLHSRKNNNIVRNLHERYLRLIYYDKNSSYEELLKMAQSLYITEMCKLWRLNCTKLKMDFCQNFLMKFLLVKQRSHYDLRRCNDFRIPSIRTVYHGSESILGPNKAWNILYDETSLNSFKKSVKKWKSQDWPCRPCKVYINRVGFYPPP